MSISTPYRLLQSQLLRNRVSQSMAFQTIDSLTSKLTLQQLRSLTRLILQTKSVSRRTTIDNYILMRSSISFAFFESILVDKGDKSLQEVCKHLYYGQAKQNHQIYSIGQVADRFFVVMRGEVSVQVTDRRVVMGLEGDDRVEETVREVARIQMGEVFGETTLKENAKRAVNTLAVTDCEFFQIKKRDYEKVIKYMIVSEMRARFMFLEEIELFRKLNQTSFESLLYSMDKYQVKIGHRLYSQSQPVDHIYIIRSGQFKLQKLLPQPATTTDLSKLKLAHKLPKKCSIFVVASRQVLGDSQMFSSGLRQHTCICITETAELFRISRKDFQMKVMEDPENDVHGIMDYLYEKNMRLAERLEEYSRVDRVIGRGRRMTLGREWGTAKRLTGAVASRVGNREYDTDEKTPYQLLRPKRKSIRSESLEDVTGSFMPTKRASIPLAARMISDIVQQKRKYIRLRGLGQHHAFQLRSQMPTYFRVKMNLKNPQRLCKTQTTTSQSPSKSTEPIRNLITQLSSTKPQLRAPSKLSKLIEPKSHHKSATPYTQYGQFFTRPLQL